MKMKGLKEYLKDDPSLSTMITYKHILESEKRNKSDNNSHIDDSQVESALEYCKLLE